MYSSCLMARYLVDGSYHSYAKLFPAFSFLWNLLNSKQDGHWSHHCLPWHGYCCHWLGVAPLLLSHSHLLCLEQFLPGRHHLLWETSLERQDWVRSLSAPRASPPWQPLTDSALTACLLWGLCFALFWQGKGHGSHSFLLNSFIEV